MSSSSVCDVRRDEPEPLGVEQRQPYKPDATGHPKTCRCPGCQLAAFLKILANAGSFGILAEVNPIDHRAEEVIACRVDEHLPGQSHRCESGQRTAGRHRGGPRPTEPR